MSSEAGLGPVVAGEIYPLKAFQARMGLSASAWRELEKDGLKPIIRGKRKFVRGQDVISYFDRLAKSEG